MNAFNLLFGPVPNALCAMFEYGILPREEDFLELTPEQYRKYIETFGDVNEKVYMIVPQHDPSLSVGECNDMYCLTEFEKKGFIDAISIIEKYCEGQNFITDEQKLKFAASKLPEPFSRGTKYAASHNMKVVTSNPNKSEVSMGQPLDDTHTTN